MHSRNNLHVALAFLATVALHAQSSNNNGKSGSAGGADKAGTGGAANSSPGANANGAGAASVGRAAAKFELPRLKGRGDPREAGALARTKVTVDELSTQGKTNVRTASSQRHDYLVIDGGTSWSRPVRGGPKDTAFVSFLVTGSTHTIVEAAGARLRVHAAAGKPGYAQLQAGRSGQKGVTWIDFGGPVKLETHGGKALAGLPPLTVRLDRTEGVWDLFVASRLVLTDQPLAALPKGAPNQFTVHAGADGALVSGLISADENPLFEDENANGIDDDFEKRQNRGAVLAARAQAAERATLARQWQQEQQRQPAKPWSVQRPMPDGAAAAPAGKKG